jgi:multisubunit Na+/H+ antiporter MnhC subunit
MKALRTVASALNLLLLIIGVIVVISAVMSRNDFVLIVILVAVGLFLVGTGWINRRALKQEDTTRNPGCCISRTVAYS